MGLFSSKTVVTVGTTVSRIVEDASLPNSIKTGGLAALVKDGESIDYIRDELLQGIGFRAESMYHYAEDKYSNGLPSGQYFSNNIGEPAVKQVLESIEGVPVIIEYSRLGSPNGFHIGWISLINSHGYDPVTNKLNTLSITKGVNVYLDDMTLVVPTSDHHKYSESALTEWGTPASAGYTPNKVSIGLNKLVTSSPLVLDALATEDYIRVAYVWKSPNILGVSKGTFNIPIVGYDDTADYFQVKYTVGGLIKYWVYKVGEGTYPSLDNLLDTAPIELGTYFPFVYFRYNKAAVSTDVNNMEFKTSKKTLKYLGINYVDMIDAINSNPGIADVQQAMLLMAVPAVTSIPIEQRYLFDYFNSIYKNTAKQYAFTDSYNRLFIRNIPKNGFIIQDTKFKMSIRYDAIYKQIKIGTFPTIVSGYGSEDYIEQVETLDIEGAVSFENINSTRKYHFYRNKVTSGIYEEIKVYNLEVTYYVLGDYTVIADETDNILLIPIDRAISKKYNVIDRELLYTRSLHYVFNSVQITKVKWYQQGWFGDLLKIVGLVLTVMSFGTDGGAFYAALSSLSYAAIAAVVKAFIIKMLIGYIIGQILILFVQAIGIDAAVILAVVAAAYGFYTKMDNINMQQVLWGDNLLKLANGLMSGIQETVKDLMEDLMQEASEFSKFVGEQTKTLEDAKELLHNRVLLSPFVIFGETPKEYYDRTVHSGNIGVVGISAVGKYVETALTLPKLRDTLGENNYG